MEIQQKLEIFHNCSHSKQEIGWFFIVIVCFMKRKNGGFYVSKWISHSIGFLSIFFSSNMFELINLFHYCRRKCDCIWKLASFTSCMCFTDSMEYSLHYYNSRKRNISCKWSERLFSLFSSLLSIFRSRNHMCTMFNSQTATIIIIKLALTSSTHMLIRSFIH